MCYSNSIRTLKMLHAEGDTLSSRRIRERHLVYCDRILYVSKLRDKKIGPNVGRSPTLHVSRFKLP